MPAGDLITKIDGQEGGLSLTGWVDKMRGEIGSSIELTIQRQGVDKPITLKDCTHALFPSRSAVRHRVENDIGYLRVISFTEQTSEDLKKAIKDIQDKIPAEKLKGFCAGSSPQSGRSARSGCGCFDAFLDKGEVVSTRGRDPQDVTRFDARKAT